MRLRCRTHGIEVEVEGKRRRFSNLSWTGSPQCKLLTMKDPKPGRYGECVVEQA